VGAGAVRCPGPLLAPIHRSALEGTFSKASKPQSSLRLALNQKSVLNQNCIGYRFSCATRGGLSSGFIGSCPTIYGPGFRRRPGPRFSRATKRVGGFTISWHQPPPAGVPLPLRAPALSLCYHAFLSRSPRWLKLYRYSLLLPCAAWGRCFHLHSTTFRQARSLKFAFHTQQKHIK
jgi:hypothetical protein